VKPPTPELYEGLIGLIDAGVASIDSIGSDVKKDGVIESSYDATPLVPAKSLFEGISSVHQKLSEITAPVLLLTSREDHVVTSDNGDDLATGVSGPLERIWLENSYHVATIDNDQELVESLTVDFLARVL
jgi:carboxylesterase